MKTTALISLGSNLGDRRATIAAALETLDRHAGIVVVRASGLREYPAVGGPPDQPAFLNGAAKLETDLGPRDLLRALLAAELEQGRSRSVRWQARTLDIDLILYADQVIDEPDFQVPHPRFALRPFVLEPLAEIAPDFLDPLSQRSIASLLNNLQRRPARLIVRDEGDRDVEESVALLSGRLEHHGWVVTGVAVPDPTFVAFVPGLRSASIKAGSVAQRARAAQLVAPDRCSCPVYWSDLPGLPEVLDEIVAICRGITNT